MCMKRLLIYLTYDKQNIIDAYIGYFLHCMRPIADTIITVCNMPYIEKGLHNLSDHADGIFYRENKGLDCGGFKDGLCQFVGWEQLKDYDEVILANDSFYGPFQDIGHIFLEMEARHLDFWGLMKRGSGAYGMTGKDPEHILSFFYVFQAPMIHSLDFRSYWEDMPYYKDYRTVVKQYERQLTKHFAELGYTYGTYADTEPNESSNPRNQFFQCDYLSYEMITKRRFPFLKRKQLSYNPLFTQTQENLSLSIAYVDQQTDYDVNLIWENLIRVMNPAHLQRSLGLQYVLEDGEEKERLDAVVIVRAGWLNAADTVCEYLENIRRTCDVWIYGENEDLVERYKESGYFAVLSNQSDIQVIQKTDIGKYRYLCLIHDCDLSSEQIPSCTGKSYFFNIWENLLKNAGYLNRVTRLFDAKPYIGMLMHPVPIFSTWIGKLEWDWKNRYEEISRYIGEMGLNAVSDPQVPPVHVTNNFWVRTDVIKPLAEKIDLYQEKEVTLSEACDYLWTYGVQDLGKLTGIVESTFYASMNEVNYHHYLRTLMGWFSERYGPHEKLHEFKEVFRAQEAAERCKEKYGRFYVYGTGEMAERCFPWVKEALAFIVSDGHRQDYLFHGKPVICLSDLKNTHDYGIILCLSKENCNNVTELLNQRGIWEYYSVY